MIKRDIIVVLGCAYMALILSGHIGSGIMAITRSIWRRNRRVIKIRDKNIPFYEEK